MMRGGVVPVLLGSWKYVQGTYSFKENGSYDVHFDYMRPAGPGQPDKHVVGDDKGSWSADNQYVYFKSGLNHVLRDKFKLSADGSELQLFPKFVKVPEVLRRLKDKKTEPIRH
jgi:hypothetical protein